MSAGPHLELVLIRELAERLREIGTDPEVYNTRDPMHVLFVKKAHTMEPIYPYSVVEISDSNFSERFTKGNKRVYDDDAQVMIVTSVKNWRDAEDIMGMKADILRVVGADPFFKVDGVDLCQDSQMISQTVDYSDTSDPLAIITTRLSVTFGMADGDPTVLI